MGSEDMIKEIVDRVIRKLDEAGGAGPSRNRSERYRVYTKPSSSENKASCLVVFTAGDGRLDEVYRQMSMLSRRYEVVEVFLSPSAKQVVDIPAVRRACPNLSLLPDRVTHEMRKLVERCNAVYFPNLTLSTASKISFLDGDSAASLMGIFALMRSKPVIAAVNSLYGVRDDYPQVPEGFKNRAKKILKNLDELGAALVDITSLAAQPEDNAPEPERRNVEKQPQATSTATNGNIVSVVSLDSSCAEDPADCSNCGRCAEMNEQAVQNVVTSGADRIGATPGTKVNDSEVAGMIDHTLLKADATEEEIRKLCDEARKYRFASVCVNPSNVALASRLLRSSGVRVCTVIGFPLGATTPTAKAIESRDAIANGATELDMVINVGALKSGDDDLVRRDIESVVEAAKGQAIVKVILETALLSDEEKVKACLMAKMAGADFVKTSTGFASGGATAADIALMRETVGPDMGVKASGGIRDLETAREMVEAGADRIGASASVAIAKGENTKSGGY